MMRLFIQNGVPANAWGESDRWLVHLSVALRERGHTVYCAGREGSRFLEKVDQAGIPVFPLRMGSDVSIISAVKLARMFKDLQIDVVLTHLTRDVRLAGMARQLSRVAVLMAYHGIPLLKDNWRYRFTYRELADGIITSARAVEREYRKIRWMNGYPVKVIPPGVPPTAGRKNHSPQLREKLGIPDRRPVIGIFGQLVRYKQHLIFLEVARNILQEWPEAIFLIVGDGPLRTEIQKYAFDLNILDHLYMLGNHTEDLPEIYGLCDLVLLTSEIEGVPCSLLEAMVAERAVIAFDVGGVGELIEPEETGILVPLNDIYLMTQRTLELLLAPEERERLGRAARRAVEKNFSFERAVNQFENYLQEVLLEKDGGKHGT
ncbi:MAG: glycosyltransferase family 4 protein [Calditrichaeota bacterium]|nr:glycosyltransferase family 4 protein [Calditrichota bacterium]